MKRIDKIFRKLFFCCAGIFFLAFTSSSIPEREKHTWSDGKTTVMYETRGGLMDGDYFSYYSNDAKKCEGKFSNNMRVGLWTVYDSLGNKKMQRNYKNSFEYEQVFPELPKDGPIKLLNEPIYKLSYNKYGFIDYSYLEERACVMSKRIWRTISVENNPIFFSKNKLIQLLVDSVVAKKYKVYADDEFRDTISKQNRERLLDTSSYDVIGYEIKEDWFFDGDRMLSESRIIGISPVVVSRVNSGEDKFEYHLGWFYFPRIRKGMAQLNVKDKSIPKYIHTFDDLFFFRYFHGDIYKESNIRDRLLSDYTKPEDLPKERERIEIDLLEREHNLWIHFSK
jgi:gliding motility associated protien GldN